MMRKRKIVRKEGRAAGEGKLTANVFILPWEVQCRSSSRRECC